jgi:hypothetical protein
MKRTRRAVATRGGARRKPASATSVRAYIKALPEWQRELAARFDELVGREVPAVKRVIKWGLPFYGVAGRGWFVSCGGFPTCVKVTFFQGSKLEPLPPAGKGRQLRGIELEKGGALDDRRMASWVRQAAALPGFGS